MPGLALQLLGLFSVTVDGRPFGGLHIRPAVALCVYLTCRPERHRREQLMALLWPDWPPAAAHKNLRQNLYTLRQALPEVAARDGRGPVPLVLADRETLQLNPDAAVDLDVERFRSLLRQNTPEATTAAIALYRGDFLADFYLPDSAPFEEWAAALRADLRRQMLEALDRLAAHALDHHAPGEAAAYARRQLAMDNLHESAYRQLMRALALLGQRPEALAQYELCAHLLRVELDMEPSAETRELAGRIAGGETDLITPDASGAKTYPVVFAVTPRHNLPLELSSFIGREREISDVQRLLGASRLVTLTGAGGCGKSRLSLEAAHGRLAAYPDGTWLIELAPLSNPDLVLQTIAYTIGLRDQSGRLLQEALTDYLRSRNTLLVLDNCEHLIETCAAFSEALLRACPRLHILATSREALAVTGETLYVVPSLQLPEPDQQPGEMADVESVRLFVERATAARPGFELTDCNAVAVAQICRRLDGIPLAIELAAARVKALSAAQIADRLDDRFQFLTAGSRTALPRQQTLRATIDWSYNLLSEPERRLFRRLAVFRGGWTLEAAEAVCTGPDLTGFGNLSGLDVFDLLGHLVDKSLVMAKEADGVIRYSRLETIRQYGCEKLEESGELEQMRRRHLDYFLNFAERGDRESRGPRSLEWMRRLDSDYNNLRAALEYTSSAEGASDAVVRLTLAVGGFNGIWSTCSWKEALYWLEKALAHPDALPSTALRARLLFNSTVFDGNRPWGEKRSELEECLAIFDRLGETYRVDRAYVLMWLGFSLSFQIEEREKGFCYMEEAIQIFEDLGERWGQGFALNLYAGVVFELDKDFNAAWTLAERGMEVARQSGEQFLIAVFVDNFGFYNVCYGLYREGQGYLEKALEVYRQYKAIGFACQVLKLLGDVAPSLSDYEKAETCYKESLMMVLEIGWISYQAAVDLSLGTTSLYRSKVDQAMSYFNEALELSHEHGLRFIAFYALDCLAAACAVQHNTETAARLFGAFEAQLDELLAEGYTRCRLFDAIDVETHEHFLSIARAQLDEATFEKRWQEGRELTLEEATQLALATIKE